MKLKKYVISFVLILLATLVIVSGVKGEVDRKPIDVKEMSYAEEVIEYEEESKNDNASSMVNNENLQDEIKVNAEIKSDEISILVFGNSKISLTPDRAKITASIETINNDMSKSKEDNLEIFNKVIEKLKDMGIEEGEIILSRFNCYPNYDYGCGRNIVGYRSTTSFSVNVKSLDKIKECVDAMIGEGVTNIYDVVYEVSNMEDQYNEALTLAVENARVKAVKVLNRDDLKIVSVKEECVYSCNCLYRNYADSYSASDMVGKVEIEAKVLVEFN